MHSIFRPLARATFALTVSEVVVHYYDFEVQRITGLHEEQMTEFGCRYLIDARDLSLVISTVPSNDYDAQDVRVRIQPEGAPPIFVDHNGRGSDGRVRYLLDKEMFKEALIPAGPCGPTPGG